MIKTAIIIIAAGGSSRMKKAKQLLPWRETTLLGHTIKQAKATKADEVILVLGARFEKIRSSIEEPAMTIVENKEWKKGIGSSIACGVNHLLKHNDHEAVLLMLADQPLIDSAYLNHVIEIFQKNPSKIIATKYPGSNGVPALFPKDYFGELLKLKEDVGARNLLNSGRPILILDSGNKLFDVDTPEAYAKIRKHSQ